MHCCLKVNLLPKYDEILMLSYSSEEVITLLEASTKNKFIVDVRDQFFPFRGQVLPDSFKLFIRSGQQPTQYFPLITGKIEEFDEKTLVKLDYRLAPSTIVTFFLTSFIAIFIGVVFFLLGEHETIVYLSFIFLLFNYLLMRLIFSKNLKISKEELRKVLL